MTARLSHQTLDPKTIARRRHPPSRSRDEQNFSDFKLRRTIYQHIVSTQRRRPASRLALGREKSAFDTSGSYHHQQLARCRYREDVA